MKLPKNSSTLILICTSIILLLALQFFWLHKELKDQHQSFDRETHTLLRNTVFELADSVMLKNIEPLSNHHESYGDSVLRGSVRFERQGVDTIENIQVFISSTYNVDSIQDVMRPLVSKIRRNRDQKTFLVRLSADSLPVKHIEAQYKIELASIGIHLPFHISKTDQMPLHMQAGLASHVISPSGAYSVQFEHLTGFLLLKILPQILFSLFLTLLTVGAFIVMYRSLTMQQRLVEIKNGFISNMTHELKTPITTVGVALEALRNFKGLDNPQRTQEYLEIAESELKRLSLLTDKVLKSALFESNETQFHFERLEIDELLDQVIHSMKLIFDKRHAQVELTKTGSHFQVKGDRDHLMNVFYNLIDNSIKYSADGVSVMLELTEQNDSISIAVSDNGIGIPQEHQKKIFDKFYRVPTGDVHNTKGYGLGLSYVQEVVKSHLGAIDLKSEPGRGSSFTIMLPKQK